MRTISSLAVAVLLVSAGCEEGTDPEAVSLTEQAQHGGVTNKVIRVVDQVNLVSDQPGKAQNTDPNLVNAWGLAFAPAGRAWVSSAEKGLSQIYDSQGKLLLSVRIPPPRGGTESHPTGQVFNNVPGTFKGDLFIFATEDGTIAGWQPTMPTQAVLRVDRSDRQAIYKGVTLGHVDGQTRLYAADFHNGKVDVWDSHYQPVRRPGQFTDPGLPAGYAPFNVLAKGRFVFVTYALQDKEGEDDVAGRGHGFLDVFDADGDHFVRLVSRGALNSPWGMAFGPSDFLTSRLYLGNFGDGHINVFRIEVGDDFRVKAIQEGVVGDSSRRPLTIDGLWALGFGPGTGGFSADDLFFTAGPDDEAHGLFGKLVTAPP
jgi:uncharacterized protein (TIGR03118 family)